MEDVYNTTRDRLTDKPVVVHGGLNLSATAAGYSGPQPRYDNFGFNVGANLNFDVLGVDVPFSVYFADKNVLYRLPSYQFAGLSPSYKWLRLHIGDRNLDFSPYTFSNQTFRGVGAEVTPGRWSGKVMGGRLRNQSLFDVGARSGLETAYRRNGYAGEVGYRADKWGLKGIVFAAEDKLPEGGTELLGPALGVSPAQNFVGSLAGDITLLEDWRLEGEYSRSFLTADVTAAAVPDSLAPGFRPIKDQLSTRAADVIKVGLQHRIFRLGYERIAPGYQSLGTLFLQDDRDNLTAGATFQLGGRQAGGAPIDGQPAQAARQPWTLSVDGGIERNGITDASADRGRRLIARILANGRVGEHLGINASFSNFSSTSRLRGFTEAATGTDSVFLAQVNRQAQFGASYLLGEGGAGGSITAQASLTDVSTLRNGALDGFGSTVSSLFAGYNRQWSGSGTSLGVQGLYARTAAGAASQTTYGPSLTAGQELLNGKLRLTATTALTFINLDEGGDSRVLNVRPSASYNLEQFGNVTLGYTHTARQLAAQGNFSENLATLTYGWSF